METEQHIYFFESIDTVSQACHLFSNHTLVYLYSGRLYLRNQCGETLDLPPTSETESLFRSWIPYMREGREISETVLRLKMTETVYALLNTDKRYIPTLFDFAGKCRMDMFDLLNKPMTKEIKWQELQFEPDSKLN